MAAAVTAVGRSAGVLVLAGLMMSLLGVLALTGKPPGGEILQRFEPGGIVAASPSEIQRVEIRAGKERLAFRRNPAGSWTLDGRDGGVSRELVAHLETALRFMHVSAPMRTLAAIDDGEASAVDFGLDPPDYMVSLGAADKSLTSADFGALTPAQTAQYVRLLGRPSVYLLPRHVGTEWRLVADLARRSLPAAGSSARMLLPVSIDQVWAIEIVFGGKLHRFERDGAGNWFLHVGQHTHTANGPGHVADPVKAPIIAAALAAFGETEVEDPPASRAGEGDRARFGLERPMLIVLLYPRDSSTSLARIEIGDVGEDGFSRYVQLSQEGEVMRIAAYEPQRLVDLLQAVGANR